MSYAHAYSLAGAAVQTSAAMFPRQGEHIDDVDAQLPRQDVLIPPRATSNRQRSDPPLSVRSYPQAHPSFGTAAVIQSNQNTLTNNNGQDVQPTLNDVSSRPPPFPTTSSYHQDVSNHRLENSFPSASYRHAPINTSPDRVRTSLPAFDSTKLAAHYGIPTRLPPLPRVNNSNNKPPVPRFHEPAPATIEQQPPSASSNEYNNHFQSLLSGYLNMIDRNSDSGATAAPAVSQAPTANHVGVPHAMERTSEEAVHSIYSTLCGDEFTSPPWTDMNDFLTSPFLDDDSPYENFLETPIQGNTLDAFMTSPMLADNQSLFGADIYPSSMYGENGMDVSKMTISGVPSENALASQLDGLIAMPPDTPALEPLSTLSSPLVEDVQEAPSRLVLRAKSKEPTGTRKNLTPDALVPLEAPTQIRKYSAPSATSRKELPAIFARKRQRSVAFADEEDELEGEGVAVTTTEQMAIEAKRRQNTLAARRSRKRKLEYQRQLEEAMDAEKREKDMWRERALMLRSQMMSLGYPEPFRDEA